MRILILGAGKMGSFFTDVLSFDHECAVYEIDAKRMRFLYNTQRFTTMQEIEDFKPELVINAVTLKYTIEVFKQVLPHLPKDCIISDISSVKTGFKEYYDTTGFRYVSTHPMFGPTFANLGALSSENAIVINEGDYMGRIFFLDLYRRLGLNVHEYSFEEHDEAMALGEEATGKDTKGIFHFNPGIEQKTFPDYNPYTISKCKTCDLAKGDKSLKLDFIPSNILCAGCALIRDCYADLNKSETAVLSAIARFFILI